MVLIRFGLSRSLLLLQAWVSERDRRKETITIAAETCPAGLCDSNKVSVENCLCLLPRC